MVPSIVNRIGNSFTTKNYCKKKTELAKSYPKGKYYRKELRPFLGSCIEMTCDTFSIEEYSVVGNKCVRVLLENPQVTKVPAKLREFALPKTSHLWIVLDKDWVGKKMKNIKSLIVRGFLNEYEHKGFRNIGMKVVATKIVTV